MQYQPGGFIKGIVSAVPKMHTRCFQRRTDLINPLAYVHRLFPKKIPYKVSRQAGGSIIELDP